MKEGRKERRKKRRERGREEEIGWTNLNHLKSKIFSKYQITKNYLQKFSFKLEQIYQNILFECHFIHIRPM